MTTTRNIGFNVATKTTEEWLRTFRHVSALACDFGARDQYVSIWSSATDDEVDAGDVGEVTTYDDHTLRKVREAITKAASPYGIDSAAPIIDDILNELQNAGILFRERVK
jgi:hypothetical protein